MDIPRNIGIGGFERTTADFDKGPKLIAREMPRSLAVLSRTHAIFTYSPLFLFGGLRYNPVQEYLNEQGLGRIVELMVLPIQYFPDFPDPWGYILWTCPLEHWDGVMMHIGTTACLDRTNSWFSRPVYQEFESFDVAHALSNPAGAAQSFPLSAFGVDATHGYYMFRPQQRNELPTFERFDPDPQTQYLGESLLAEGADVTAVVRAANAEVFNVHQAPGTTTYRSRRVR